MQQQPQPVAGPGKPHQRAPRGPWLGERTIRIMLAIAISLILSALALVGLLVTGHLSDISSVATVASALILAIIAVLAWLLPFNPFPWKQPPQSPPTPIVPQPPTTSLPVTLAQTNMLPTTASPVQLPPVPPSVPIFHIAQALPSPADFYGRAYERATLINRISQRGSTSLVGEYRIGKSWLIQYVQQIAPTHAQLGPHVRIGKLSATHAQCQTLTGFVKKALEVLNVPVHRPNPRETPLERLAIEVAEMKKQGILPVLCIDEFAGLLDKPDFGKSFVEGLRAIAEDDGLVLITASRESLHTVIEQMTGETSPLFNIMPELTLQPFTETEAKEFIDAKSQQGKLNQAEQAFLLECAAISQAHGQLGWPPLRLQQAGQLLLADKYAQESTPRALVLNDLSYRADFKKRLDEQYQKMVKH